MASLKTGVIGLGLLVLTVILAARAALRSPCDGLLLAAAAALAACGLTDFGLRIPGIALTVAMLLSAARRPETASAATVIANPTTRRITYTASIRHLLPRRCRPAPSVDACTGRRPSSYPGGGRGVCRPRRA